MENNQSVIAIRRENKNNWERRTALTPATCRELIQKGFRIIVQPCNIRCYTNFQYEDAGCEIKEDITEADIIVGVKEVALEKIVPNKTMVFFSHTFKGQTYNMPLLKKMLDSKIRLIDYELIKDENSNRLIAFGRYAGIVGAVDVLNGLGKFLLMKGLYTPFLHVSMTYNYPSLDKIKNELGLIGEEIQMQRFPKELSPFIFGVTGGKGRVAQGAIEMLKCLPHQMVTPEELPGLVKSGGDADKIYIVELSSCHLYKKGEESFDKADFYANPDKYESIFGKTLLPYISVLVHCMFWDNRSPKVLIKKEVEELSKAKNLRLVGVTDITCDPDGSSDLFKYTTEIEEPFYAIDPETMETETNFTKCSKKSVLYHSVDHLPAELPIESSNHFSTCLAKYLPEIAKSTYPSKLEEQDLPPEIKSSIIVNNGKLAPEFTHLEKTMYDNI